LKQLNKINLMALLNKRARGFLPRHHLNKMPPRRSKLGQIITAILPISLTRNLLTTLKMKLLKEHKKMIKKFQRKMRILSLSTI